MNFPFLTLITFIPLLGAVVAALIPGEREREIKLVAVLFSVPSLVLSLVAWVLYAQTAGGIQMREEAAWIPTLNAYYRMGVDGISLPLVFLTTLLTTLGLFYSAYTIKKRHDGHYVFVQAALPPQAGTIVERNLRLTEQILRFMITLQEAA